MYGSSWIVLCCYVVSINSSPQHQHDGELLSVVQVFRHGQRVPFKFYPNDPYKNKSYWGRNVAQLTNKGKLQAYNLGKYTRDRYRDFLPLEYSEEFFKAYTTDTDRTHMSAQAFLAGLYPPTEKELWNQVLHWQPIPIRPVPNSHLYQTKCPAYTEASDEEFSKSLKDFKTSYGNIVDYVEKHAGINFNDFFEVLGVADALFIENDIGLPLPNWTEPVYPEPLKSFIELYTGVDGQTDVLKRLGCGPFLNIVLKQFETKLKNSSTTNKLSVYSGHDTNILGLLKFFGQNHFATFSSSLYFELRKSKESEFINIYFKNGDSLLPIKIPGCDCNCSLSQFKNLFKDYIIDDDIFNKECQLNSDKNQNDKNCSVTEEGKKS